MKTRLFGKKGQSATELAVLGSLVIMAFSYLITYTEKLNREQSYLQQTFRYALKAAYGENGMANVMNVNHRRAANVSQPYALGSLDTFSSSAGVLWIHEYESDPSDTYLMQYRINGQVTDLTKASSESEDGQVTHSNTTTTTNAQSNSTFTKQESRRGISTSRSLRATDTLTYSLQTDEDSVGGTFQLGLGGKYDSEGGVNRSQSWNAAH